MTRAPIRSRALGSHPLASLATAEVLWEGWREAWGRSDGDPAHARAAFTAWAPAAAAMLDALAAPASGAP